MTKVNRSRSLRAAVVAGVMALLLGPAAAAQAAVVNVNFNITGGELVIGALPVEIPAAGATLAGTWDDETGAFDGTLNIPAFNVSLDPATSGLPIAVDLAITITTTPVVGTVPPDGTEGSVTTSLSVNVNVAALTAACDLGPISLELTTTLVEEAGDVILVATATGFQIPAAVCSNPSFDALVNPALGLPTSETSIGLTGVLGDVVVPPTPEPEPITPAEVEAQATPRFTG